MIGSRHVEQFLWAFLIGALMLALVTPGIAFAQDRTSEVDPTLPAPPKARLIGPPAPDEPKSIPYPGR